MAASSLIWKICVLLLVLYSTTDARIDIIVDGIDIAIGENKLLLCKAGGEGEITWKKDGEEIDKTDMVEVVDETSSKLSLQKVTLEDSGTYTCLCNFDSGHEDKAETHIYVYEKLDFGATKKHHEFLVNQNASIPCMVTGKPEVVITWIRNGYIVHRDEKQHFKILEDNTLYITNIQREDHGSFVCQGQIKGRPVKKDLPISVVVNVPPTVVIKEKVKKVVAGPDTSVSIICSATGIPAVQIAWTTPPDSDSSRYTYNSDKSELTVPSVIGSDRGQYICTASNKIGESSASLTLDVSEQPVVILTHDELLVEPGQNASVYCNASGHPTPTIKWIRKSNQEDMGSSKGRVRVVKSGLIFENVAPSDGGIYSCIAENAAGRTTQNFSLQTTPGTPRVQVIPGTSSALFILNATVLDGGSPITKYVLQWRRPAEHQWSDTVVQSTDQLVITSLEPFSQYSVRIAAQNQVGSGSFSAEVPVRTLRKREPESPVLSSADSKVEENSYSVSFKQLGDGGSPILHYIVRYKTSKEGEDWRERTMPSNSTKIQLSDLEYDSDYHMEIIAVNLKGSSSPAKLNFTVPQPAVGPKSGLGKGGVVGIVMLLFFVMLVAVDALCCYTNRCGILMFLAVKFCGKKVPGQKSVEQGDGNNSVMRAPANGDPATEA